MIKCAMFDLDGTLVNTIDDLARATDYTIKKFGFNRDWSKEEYTSFVGNGAKLLLKRAFDNTASDEMLDSALEVFKKKYEIILLDNAYAYDNVKTSLDYIKNKGIKLAVVTNKPSVAATKMVETVFGKDYFDVIVGATEDTPKKPDPYMPNKALRALGVRGEETVYFGDSDVDVKTARSVNAYAVACSWGFRSIESLEKAKPDSLISNPSEIQIFFEKNC